MSAPTRPVGRLDPRLRRGLAVTVADLVAVFLTHHHRDRPACAVCGHVYTTAARWCPSETLARQLLACRRHERPAAVAPIIDVLTARDTRALPDPAATAPAAAGTGELFPVADA
ncbi:hypothetical protein GCM10010124_26630 [Pilimelia terevasa]|uniref:Uncharacterized protein n=1 Tax=Pilimelia terevasa TaxID=53372 RepID=A0A8J3FJ74_9ACTN|nr:hypothetical protein [Pilimelia terevasa]GGK32512.1 hypothetical protein GCM10010124_26630 [Pilimelia terevasa]